MASEINVKPSISSGLSSTTTHQHSHKGNSMDDPPQKDDKQSNKRKQIKKNRKKSQKKPKAPTHMDVIQLEIDKLKQEARRAYEIQARQNATDDPIKLTEEDQNILDNRLINSSLIDKLEDLKVKVSSQEMIRKFVDDHGSLPSDHPIKLTEYERFQQETVTLLHFFYIVRLAQKGFFNFISQSYPNVNPDALIHLCDRLVGGSLFVVKDPVKEVQSSKKAEVFFLLRKLHNGAPEPIGGGYSTTFEQIRHMIHDFIDSATTPSSQPIVQKTNDDHLPASSISESIKQQPPIWLVVPFNGMVDGIQQPDTAPATTSGRKSKDKNAHDKKKPSETAADAHVDDTNPVTSSATRNTESTELANSSVSHKLGLSGNQEKDETKTAVKNYNKSISTAETEDVVDTPSIKDTLTDDSLLNDKTRSLETITDTPQTTDTASHNLTNSNGNVKKETTTRANGDTNGKVKEETSGWGTPTNTTASPAWTQGLVEQQPQHQQKHKSIIVGKEEEAPGWRTTSTTTTASPAWTQGRVEQHQQGQTTKDSITTKDEEKASGWGTTSTATTASLAWTQGLVEQQLEHQQEQTIKDDATNEQEETSSGWGDAPTATEASPAWTQGSLEQQLQKQTTKDDTTNKEEGKPSGWGDAPTATTASPAWTQGLVEQQSQQPQKQTTKVDTNKETEKSSGWGDAPTATSAASTWTQGLLKEQDQQELDITGTDKSATEDKSTVKEEASSGWGTAPTATASPAWTQGLVDQQQQEQTSADNSKTEGKDTIKKEEVSTGWGDSTTQDLVERPPPSSQQPQENGWGSPIVEEANPPAWEGKIPDDFLAPGDETISGDLSDQWRSADFDGQRSGGRGRPSRGGYRPFNDSGRGMRRGGANATGWGNRPSRP